MLKATVYSAGNPGAFNPTDKDDPQYYLALYAHEMSHNLYNLQQQGFEWRQDTQSDMGAIETLIDTWMGDIVAWLDAAVTASMADETIPAIPTPPDFHPSYEASDAGVSIWWLIIKFGLWYILLKLKKSLEGGNDVTELANIIRKAFIRENDEEEEYSLIELLANIPVQIILSRGGDYQDVVLSSQPTEE